MNTTNLLCTQRFFLRGLAVFLEWSPQNLNPSGIFPPQPQPFGFQGLCKGCREKQY